MTTVPLYEVAEPGLKVRVSGSCPFTPMVFFAQSTDRKPGLPMEVMTRGSSPVLEILTDCEASPFT